MGDSVSGIVNLSQAMHRSSLHSQLGTAVLKMANDMMKEQGQAALELLQSVPAAPQSGGSTIDVYV